MEVAVKHTPLFTGLMLCIGLLLAVGWLPRMEHGGAVEAQAARIYVPIGLERIGSFETENLGLTAGEHTLLGIPFQTGNTYTSQFRDRPNLPEAVQLDTNVDQPHALHLLIQAG